MRMSLSRIIFVAAACCLLPCGCTSVKLMTYNVGVFSKYTDDSASEVAAMIREKGAQAVAINEQDSCNRRHNVYQTKHLAECLGDEWHYAYRGAMPYVGGSYGEGLVTKDEVIDEYAINMPIGVGAEPRVCVVVETKRYIFASTHLDHVSDAARTDQARQISETLKAKYSESGKPVFLCGDLNSDPDSNPLKVLLKDWTILSKLEPTFPSDKPVACIDYIMLLNNGAKVKVLKSEVCTEFRNGDVTHASDHLPLFVEVRLKKLL